MEIRVEPTSIERLVDTVANTINESFKNVTIDDVNMYKLGYNKALDDLMAKLDCDKYLLNDWQRDAIRDKVKEIREGSN
jgi:TPP-dependent 2-oxoacid decarboxylase